MDMDKLRKYCVLTARQVGTAKFQPVPSNIGTGQVAVLRSSQLSHFVPEELIAEITETDWTSFDGGKVIALGDNYPLYAVMK